MTNLSAQTKDEKRTIEVVEKELANAQAAQQRITDDLASIGPNLEAAVKGEAEAVERAMRAGKAPKPSGEVAKLEQRRADLGRQLAVVETLADKLLAERLVLMLADAKNERAGKNVASNEALEKFRAAEAELTQAQSESQWAREHEQNVKEQLVAVRRRLAQKGVEEAGDLEERRRNEEQAEAHRRQVSQWQPYYPVLS
jgi:hypothetical protein